MDKDRLNQVTASLRALFADDEIPDDFRCHGQTFIERCEGWALHAVEQLEGEIEAFTLNPDARDDDGDVSFADDWDQFETPKGNTEVQDHEHEWVVFSTALQEGCIMVQCVQCGLHGTVVDPTREEWSAAFCAPSKPYRWPDYSRVTVMQNGPRCVARSESNPAEYERIPREIMGKVLPVTAEERADLEALMEVAVEESVDGRMFPVLVRSVQENTGREPTGAVKRLAQRFQEWCEAGFPAPPETVASVLKWYVLEGGQIQKSSDG